MAQTAVLDKKTNPGRNDNAPLEPRVANLEMRAAVFEAEMRNINKNIERLYSEIVELKKETKAEFKEIRTTLQDVKESHARLEVKVNLMTKFVFVFFSLFAGLVTVLPKIQQFLGIIK